METGRGNREPKASTVAGLARAAGVPATTVRFYERAGLIVALPRSRGGYRRFGPGSVERVRFIRGAQSLGLTLKNTRALLMLDAVRGRSDVRALLERRLAEVEARMSELGHFRDALSGALARCRRSGPCCNVLVSQGAETGHDDGGSREPTDREQDHGDDSDRRRRGGGRMRHQR